MAIQKAGSPNYRLTMEELKEMKGRRVWVISGEPGPARKYEWAVVNLESEAAVSAETLYHFRDYRKTWLAFRRSPPDWK